MGTIKTIKPVGRAQRTNQQLSDPGITYNEAGVTYNEVGITYGGMYGEKYYAPIVTKITQIKP